MVSAPSDKKEALLKELEHFAFRGIPNLSSPRPQDHIVELKDTKDGDKIAAEDAEEEKMGQGQQVTCGSIALLIQWRLARAYVPHPKKKTPRISHKWRGLFCLKG